MVQRNHTKSKEYVRRCYNCKSPDSDNDEDEKKHKKDKKEKKEKRMTFQKKKKGGGYVAYGIVMALWIVIALVMMTRNLSRKH